MSTLGLSGTLGWLATWRDGLKGCWVISRMDAPFNHSMDRTVAHSQISLDDVCFKMKIIVDIMMNVILYIRSQTKNCTFVEKSILGNDM